MKQHQLLMIASVCAVLLAIVMVFRGVSAKARFDGAVVEALKTTEGYDQRFIDRVNRLEELLAMRAQFGYSGGKDPMTGTTRQVVQPAVKKPVRPKPPRVAGVIQQAAPVEAPPPPADRVKLTAVIGDAAGKKFTAVVMDGERSFSVDPGDVVAGRKITRITNEGIYMESDTMMYFYDIYGNIVTKSKAGGAAAPVLKEDQEPEPPKTMEPPPANKRQPNRSRPK